MQRALPAITAGENGRILLPESAPWLGPFCEQVSAFTGEEGAPDDMVDALTWAVQQGNLLRGPLARAADEPVILTPGRAEPFVS